DLAKGRAEEFADEVRLQCRGGWWTERPYRGATARRLADAVIRPGGERLDLTFQLSRAAVPDRQQGIVKPAASGACLVGGERVVLGGIFGCADKKHERLGRARLALPAGREDEQPQFSLAGAELAFQPGEHPGRIGVVLPLLLRHGISLPRHPGGRILPTLPRQR